MFLINRLFSAEKYLEKTLKEAFDDACDHNADLNMVCDLLEKSGREDLFSSMESRFNSVYEDVQIIFAGERHLKAIKLLKQWDSLLN